MDQDLSRRARARGLRLAIEQKARSRGWSSATTYSVAKRLNLPEEAARLLEQIAMTDNASARWREQNRPREFLIDAVREGQLSPMKAEAEARRRGLPSFATTADPTKFDPGAETVWTLLMTLAWIVWRDLDHVRSYWDDAREEIWSWVPIPNRRGWRLEGLGRSSFHELTTLAVVDLERGHVSTCGDGAFRSLRNAALSKSRDEQIEAFGVPTQGGGRAPIPRHAWHDLQVIDFKPHHSHNQVVLGRKDAPEHGWHSVSFERDDVQRIWPAHRVDGAGLDSRSKGGEKACAKWLLQQIRAAPTKPRPQQELFDEARNMFNMGTAKEYKSSTAWGRVWRPTLEQADKLEPHHTWGRVGAPRGARKNRGVKTSGQK